MESNSTIRFLTRLWFGEGKFRVNFKNGRDAKIGRVCGSQDWFEDHDEKIQSLLKDNKLNGDRTALREQIRKLKNKWFQQKAEEAERFAKEKTLRTFYVTINAFYGLKPRNLDSMRAKNGVLLSSPENIKAR